MKDFTTIKALIDELETVTSDLNSKLESWNDRLSESQEALTKYHKTEDGYTHETKDGEIEECNSWDYDYALARVNDYSARVNAVSVILDTLSTIDLNKVIMKGGSKK